MAKCTKCVSHSLIWHSSRFAPVVERVIPDTVSIQLFLSFSNNSRIFSLVVECLNIAVARFL